MLKKAALILSMAAVSTINADIKIKHDGFRTKAVQPIEFASCIDRICSDGFDKFDATQSIEFANIAIGRTGLRPGAPIEFALGGPHWPKLPKEGSVTSKLFELANIGVGCGWKPCAKVELIEFADKSEVVNTFANLSSTIVKPEVETCKHSRCPMNIANIS
ncbi:hypothetical protein [Spartinivicinus ruber]|uniref:hypothetical protein n=1 Tax=Spartinivicinus ruber TaxID=2683272 RepID=UPI0013CF69F3|nr:hypothetical protein [Spartinivicinus ruber]